MSSVCLIKEQKRAIIRRHAQADNIKGLSQVLTTLAFLAVLWWAAVSSIAVSPWLTVAAVLLISLCSLRVFTLMHECGHGSLFRTQRLNRAFGFLLGVVSGMPQYVWSRHHSYHHAHNGDWENTLFPWTLSDFPLMDAIECGIVIARFKTGGMRLH